MGIHSWTIFTAYFAGATVPVGPARRLAGKTNEMARRKNAQTNLGSEKVRSENLLLEILA